MKKIVVSFIIAATAIHLMGCAPMSKQDVGTITGGVAGGLLGSQFGHGNGQLLATGVGVLAGGLIGSSIGKSMDDMDRMRINRALENNGVGEPAYWQNPNTGADYTVIPVRNVSVDGNQYCREYRTTAIVAGKRQQVYGTACRQPDGSWQVAN